MTQLSVRGDWSGGSGHPAGSISPSFFRRELKGNLLSASAAFGSSLTTSKGSNASARRGLRFEAKVCKSFSATYGSRFISQLPFFFQEEMTRELKRGQRGKAIPDGLLFSPDWKELCIVEVKLRHSFDAWAQTHKFYKPIVDKAFGGAFKVRVLEVVQNYDPRIKLPFPTAIILSPDEIWGLRPCFHPVLIRDKNGL